MQCFLCRGCDGKLIRFTDSNFAKLSQIVAFRKKKQFKYGDLELKRNGSAYYVACFQKVAVLKKRYKDEFSSIFPESNEVSIFEILADNNKIK